MACHLGMLLCSYLAFQKNITNHTLKSELINICELSTRVSFFGKLLSLTQYSFVVTRKYCLNFTILKTNQELINNLSNARYMNNRHLVNKLIVKFFEAIVLSTQDSLFRPRWGSLKELKSADITSHYCTILIYHNKLYTMKPS